MARIHTGMGGHVAALMLGLGLVVAPGCATPQPASATIPLSPDDVSWLFPPPKSAADLAKLIAIKDLTIPDPANPANRLPIWSDSDFNDFLTIADSAAAQVAGGVRIGLPAGVRTKDAWFVAGIRIDAGAPGLDPAVTAVFGQRPQIRLILQPVLTDASGNPQILDTAAHLIFDFVLPEPLAQLALCPIHATPDLTAFSGVVSDAAMLRTALAAGQFGNIKVSTAGLPLGVHPGLANAATTGAVAAQMKVVLQTRLSPQRLGSMAVMGLPAGKGAPWMFLSMLRTPTGHFSPVPGPTLDGTQFAMLLTPLGQTPRVAPTPHTNNLAPITCANGAFGPASLPVASRQGSSTSDIFTTPPDPVKVKAVTDLIADPTKSHFFNTDCVSCHTETRRAMEVLHVTNFPGLSPDVMPNGTYDVRNFGWSIDGAVSASAGRRTAAETAAVVAWLNAHMPQP